jgi:Peptidase family M28
MSILTKLTALDRYQASKDIESAADLVAEAAERLGLTGVEILRFPADGMRHWWTFRSPRSWTPLSARIEIVGDQEFEEVLIPSYPSQPCSIATNSVATPVGGLVAPLVQMSPSIPDSALQASIAVISKTDNPLSHMISRAERAGAFGFVTDAATSEDQFTGEVGLGRLELPLSTKLFGFSIDSSLMKQVVAATCSGAHAKVFVEVDRSASMPIVVGNLPGVTSEEILLQAHLCHPRPGANDNNSGIAALLGIAATLSTLTVQRDRVRGIRFLWGPEFVGTAAYLHDFVGNGRAPLPLCVVNLDMVGEDQHRCGGPLILERSPDHLASFVDALAERCIELLPQDSCSYTGAVPTATWTWRVTPFAGASDHALFADRMIARPAIQLGHWPDRFNHSSADTLDKVNPDELRRTATVAGATALLVSVANNNDVTWLERLVAQWGARQIADVVRKEAEAEMNPTNVIDPLSAKETIGLVEHTANVVLAALNATACLTSNGAQSSRHQLRRWLQRQVREYSYLLPSALKDASDSTSAPIERHWPGPFNLQALLEDAPPVERNWFRSEMVRNREAYGIMLALALAIDGKSSQQSVMQQAAYSSMLAVDTTFGERFLELLIHTGWAHEIRVM